jgi:hypothetical protein
MTDLDVTPVAPLPSASAWLQVEEATQDLLALLSSYSSLIDPDGGNGLPAWLYVVEAHVRRLVAAQDAAVQALRGV